MSQETILLRNKGDIVGYAKYVSNPFTGLPNEVIHGGPLNSFAKRDEHLVSVYGVQIFSEFEEREYPYRFKSFEDIPVVLGDLNKTEKAFKQIIAWDKNKVSENPGHPLPSLEETPRKVSSDIISAIRDQVKPSPAKVRFKDTVKQPHPISCGLIVDLVSDSESSSEEDVSKELFEESVDQFADELDAEKEDQAALRVTATEAEKAQRKAAAVESFMRELDQSDDDDVTTNPVLPAEIDAIAVQGTVSEKDVRGSRSLVKRMPHWDSLSPAERISIRIKNKKARRNQSLKRKASISFSGSISPRSKARRIDDSSSSSLGGTFCQGKPSGSYNFFEETESSTSCDEGQDDGNLHREGSRNQAPARDASCLSVPFAEDNVTGCGAPDVCISVRSPAEAQVVKSCGKKRGYRFKKRKLGTKQTRSSLRSRRMELVEISLEKTRFETDEKCCNNGCYSNVNIDYTIVQYRRFLLMDRVERKRALKSMCNREARKFWFDGNPVCSRFLKALSFSNQLQSAVKGTPKARASASVVACPRDIRRETRKEKVVLFLLNLAGLLGDAMPTRNQTNLPLLSKFQVYERFLKTFVPEQGEVQLSFAYFCDVWKKSCAHVKTHRHHGFTVCGLCEKLRSALAECQSAAMEATLRENMDEHYKLMALERRGYAERVDMTKKFPDKYMSTIVDGADQKSYGLPHFVFNTKDDTGHKIKVKCVGVLEHGLHKHLSLFTMTEEYESGANHVLEAIHRVLNRKKSESGRLPEVLFIQADNCTRENKNRFFMAYCELLVALGVFLEIQVSFLPIGHTHADIDQAFSTVASRLRLYDAVTMDKMIQELNNCYTPRASAQELDKIANFSGLCKATGSLHNVQGFSQFRYFRFTRRKTSDVEDTYANDFFKTTCDVKIQWQEEWTPMDNSRNRLGFLKFVPELGDTPETDTTPPDNVLEVNKHLQSCESRIGNEADMKSLQELRDKVYTRRIERFHWNLENTFEFSGDYLGSCNIETPEVASADIDGDEYHALGLRYPLNYFLAVKTEGNHDPFWIARTLRIGKRDKDGNVLSLIIRWYQAKAGSKDSFSALYVMSTQMEGAEIAYFDDTVDVRSVLCQFESLTKRGCLHVRTQKAIRQSLNLN